MKFNFQSNKIATVFPFAILLIFLRIDLILLNTLPTGGDMGAHIVPTKFFVEELFYNFKISGWSNDWFAGYPAYYFYFPLPPSIVAILNLIVPFNISFKIMVLIALVILVISVEKLIYFKVGSLYYIGFAGGLLYLFGPTGGFIIGFFIFLLAHFKIFKFAFLALGFNFDLLKDPKAK